MGIPAFSLLHKITTISIVVFELSSFQLAHVRKSPAIAVVLNIYPEHLDWHGNFAEYLLSKSNIVRYQSSDDTCIYDATNFHARSIASRSKGGKLAFRYTEKEILNTFPLHPATIGAVQTIGRLLDIPPKQIQKITHSFRGARASSGVYWFIQ